METMDRHARKFAMQLRLSQTAQSVAGLLVQARLTAVEGEPVSRLERQQLDRVAQRAVMTAVPGEVLKARRKARVAFASALSDALVAHLANETHSAHSAIRDSLLTFVQGLTLETTSPLASVFAAYEASLEQLPGSGASCTECRGPLVDAVDEQSRLCLPCRVTTFSTTRTDEVISA